MGTDYKFSIKRKADGKKLATFYYNMIKNVRDCYIPDCELAYDPNKFSEKTVLSIDQIEADRFKIQLAKMKFENAIAEKKELIAKAVSVDIKFELEDDIRELENNIKDIKYADEALVGLYAVVRCLTEDLVVKEGDDENSIACKANATDLGEDKYVFINDVELEVEALF